MSKAGGNETMRLVTRSDFDGLVCGALLKEAGVIDHWKFAHPKDLQDGLVEITEDDCAAFGSTIIPASSRGSSWKVNTKERAVWPLPVPGLSTNTTAEMSVSLILMR